MWYVCDVLYAVLYVRVSCFVVRECAVSRRYINVYKYLMSVMSPSPAMCNLSARTVIKLCILVCALRVSLVSRIVMISACVS